MSEYQTKTHFKSAETFSLNLEPIYNTICDSCGRSNQNIKVKNKKLCFSHRNLHNNDNSFESYNRIKCNYNSLQKLNYNPLIKINNENKDIDERLRALREIIDNQTKTNQLNLVAMEGNTTEIDNENETEKERRKNYLNQLNTIKINGEIYDKKDLPNISAAVLRQCNVFRRKIGRKNGVCKTVNNSNNI